MLIEMCLKYFFIFIAISLQLIEADVESKPCITHTKEEATCLQMNDCVGLKKMWLNSKQTSEEWAYLNGSLCKSNTHICCSARFQAPSMDPIALLPMMSDCREQPTIVPLLYGNADCDKYVMCSGTLINKRYLLTSAQCAIKDDLRSVHFPHQNRFNDIHIEEIHVHPDYSNDFNDIGLIRLSKDVILSTSLSAACLPNRQSYELSQNLLLGEPLIAEGVHKTVCHALNNYSTLLIVEKIRIKMTVNNFESCQSNKKQLCVSPETNTMKCLNDLGGPLLYKDKRGYNILVGITSNSSNTCSLHRSTGLYTRVGAYVDWILEIIKP